MNRKSVCILIILLAACFSACSRYDETTAAEQPREAVPAADLIRQADELFKRREDLKNMREAIALLKRARFADDRNFEAAWKLSQFSYFLGTDTTDEKESAKAFTDGIAAGATAARIAPDKPEGYFWQAACYGGEAERSPFTKGIAAVDKIRDLMQKVVAIDPKFQNSMAYDALAVIELKTSFYGGKPEKAVEYLEKGLEISPDNFAMRLHLAEAFLALERKPEAKKQLELVLKIKPSAEVALEYEKTQKQARKMLESKF